MATTSLWPWPSLGTNRHSHRLNHRYMEGYSDLRLKETFFFSVRLHEHCHSIKLYMVPDKAISRACTLRPFASYGSLQVDGSYKGSQVYSNLLGAKNSQRHRKLLDTSMGSLHGLEDLDKQLQMLLEEVKHMMKMGKRKDAIDLLQANYEAVREHMDAGEVSIEEVAMLDVLALGFIVIGDLKMVKSLLTMLDKVANRLKNDEPLLDSILTHMGSMYATMGIFEKALCLYGRAAEILEREFGDTSPFLIAPLLGMGKAFGSTGRASKAIEIYHRVITLVESRRGAESEELVIPLSALGNIFIKEGRVIDAENTFCRILDVYRKLYGEKDGRMGMAMCSLAHVKCAKGNVNEAIDLYRNALELLRDSEYMALDDNILEKMKIDLAELLHVVGREKEGRALLEECMLITAKHNGRENASLVPHLINLATSFSRSKNFAEAERLLRQSIEIMMQTVPPDDQAVSFPMLHLAVTLYNLKQFEEAEKIALEVLKIREKAFGKESPPVGEALDCLVSIQTRLEKDDSELLELLKRVLKIQESAFGFESEEVMETLKKIVYLLDRIGFRDEKSIVQKRLLTLRNKHKHIIRY